MQQFDGGVEGLKAFFAKSAKGREEGPMLYPQITQIRLCCLDWVLVRTRKMRSPTSAAFVIFASFAKWQLKLGVLGPLASLAADPKAE